MMHYAYCSAPNCAHSQLYGTSKSTNSRFPSRTVEMQKFCTECGAPMIGKCPSCGSYRESMEYKCCPNCGKPYK